jgi:hypothetical protein
MCSNRHQPCLAVSPSQSSGSAISPRPAVLPVVVISALFLLSSPGRGQTRDPQQAALDDFVSARTLSDKCPTWQIDFAMPASSTNAYPTIAASCLACHR